MLRFLRSALLIAILAPAMLSARARFPETGGGYCQKGGQTVTVAPGVVSTTKVQQSYPLATVTVYITGGASGVVSTSGTAVTWVSGTLFNANSDWNSLAITINSVSYTVSTVVDTTHLTLTSSAGTQTSVAYSASNAKAAVFSDNAGTIKANPFTCDTTGYYFFYADNGTYDVTFSGTGISVPFTNAAMWGIDPLASIPNWFVYNPTIGTAAAQCTAAFNANATLVVSQVMAALPTQTMACSLLFLKGGKLQPSSGQTVTLTGDITAPVIQIFDYVLGGTVALTSAKSPAVYPEWWPVSTTTQATVALNSAFSTHGHVILSQSLTINGPVTMTTGLVVSGVNNRLTIITGSGSTAGFVTGADAINVKLENFTFDCNSSASTGIRVAGQQSGGSLDAKGFTLSGVNVNNCVVAGFSFYHTYALALDQIQSSGSAINVKFEDGYNNSTAWNGGEIAGATGSYAVYMGVGTSNFTSNSVVCQSNAGGCYEMAASTGSGQITFVDPYFENNCVSIAGYDMKADYAGNLQTAVHGLKVIQPHLHTANCTASAYFESVMGLSVERPASSQSGAPTGKAVVILARNVETAWLGSGVGITYLNMAGGAITPSDATNFAENLLEASVALDTSIVAWSPSANVTISQDATAGPDGNLSWKAAYSGTVNSSAPATLSQNFGFITGISPAGNYFGCGVWVRTDTGTADAWVSLGGVGGNYGGSAANSVKQIIGTAWTWIWFSASWDSADTAGPSCGFNSFGVTGSPTAVYLAKPQAWQNAAGQPQYISTTTKPFSRGNNSLGHTVFAQLGTANKSQPVICDDCTIANPTAGSGSGALAVPIGTVWVGK